MSIDPFLPIAKQLGEDLGKNLIEKSFADKPKTAVEQAVDDKLADIIAQADVQAFVEQMKKARSVMGLRRDLNAKRAIDLALALASDQPQADLQPPDTDWFNLWFDAVQNVSDETVQELWARAFAQQADVHSKGISIRALDSLRLMDHQAVSAFHRIGSALMALDAIVVPDMDVINAFLNPDDLEAMRDLQLVALEESFVQQQYLPGTYVISYALPDTVAAPDPYRAYRLTSRGKELFPTLPPDLETEYDTPGAFDLDGPEIIPRYINLLAYAFKYLPNKLRLNHRTPSPDGRLTPAGPQQLRWSRKKQRWKVNAAAEITIPDADLEVFLSGKTGVAFIDDQRR